MSLGGKGLITDAVAKLVEALRYEPEVDGFDSQLATNKPRDVGNMLLYPTTDWNRVFK
jgi:hypothetical protein